MFRATVPYAALIPETLDNVIIAGKAYCATHDALSAARMQRDLCVMGMVAAEAVRLARIKNVLLRNIPVPELQATLMAKGMLKAEDLADDNLGFPRTPEELAKKIGASSEMDGALMASAMLCLLPKEQTLKLLEPYLASPNAAVQRLLCFLGHPKGVESYLAQVSQALDASPLTEELFGGTATKHLMPDQGYAPVAALMLGSLARAREQRAVPLLVKLAERIHSDPAGQDLRAGWGYFYSLACGFERLPAPEGRSPLRRVLEAPIFNGRMVSRNGDLRKCNDTFSERFCYLRMALSRALLRCGDSHGALLLCEFLNEARVCIARAARSELVAASGQDFGFDAGRWRTWVQANGAAFQVNPLTISFA